MKKLNLLLMMLASFSLITLSSCEGTDKPVNPTDITLAVSGGTSVELKDADIAKDITVTASEKATKDIVVKITSDAAAGEAAITPAEVTIKEGEMSATSTITFAAAKFPKGTAEKKITVSISTTTDGVKPDAGTTEFKVKGEEGKVMPTLTITSNGTDFNTTKAEAPVTFTFTLSEAATAELPVTVTFGEGTSEAIKTLFAPLAAAKFAVGATSLPITVNAPKGTEGKLIANFAVEDKNIDLKTTTISATFTVDRPTLTITANSSEFNTTTEAQTMTVTPTLSEAIAEELTIAVTYDGSDDNMKELFKAVTSIKIAAGATTAPIDFVATKGTAGKLVVNFAIENTGVTLKTTKLEATFKVVVSPLCAGPADRGRYYICKQFIIGDYTSAIHEATVTYTDLIKEGTVSNVKEGDLITIFGKNATSGANDPYKAYVWVDWNNDGLLDNTTERVLFEDILAGENDFETTVKKAFNAPAGTSKGRYAMRIGTSYANNVNEDNGAGGCASYETTDFTDILINYTPAAQ